MKRILWFVLASLALLLVAWTLLVSGATPPVSAQANPTPVPDLVAVYRKMIDASNKGEVASAVVAYADDAVIISPSCPEANPCAGKAGVQKNYENNAAGHTRVDIVAVTVTTNTIQSITEVRNDRARELGFERIVVNGAMTFTGNKISRNVLLPEPSDPQTTAFLKALQPDPEAVVRKMVADKNKGDIASALAAYTDDAVLVNPYCPPANPCVGKAAIQKVFETEAQSHTLVDILAVTVFTNTVQSINDVRLDSIKALGLERIILNGTVTFTGNKISRHVMAGEPTDPQTMALFKALQAQATPVPK